VSNLAIELLSPQLIIEHKDSLQQIENLSNSLWREIGWHYQLDFLWILSNLKQLGVPGGANIVDAGAGNGLLQYLLAEQGYNVISVDFSKRRFPFLASLAFPINQNRRSGDAEPKEDHYIGHLSSVGSFSTRIRRLPVKLLKNRFDLLGYCKLIIGRFTGKRKPGTIIQYCTDMKHMNVLASDSIDAVVSVSAIEHMEKDDISVAIDEFYRILKPKAALLVTTSASKEDYFHEPSKGWCFSEQTLIKIFGLTKAVSLSNYHDYDAVLGEIRESEYLKQKLSSLYFASYENGMPLGIWDPKYIPVGIITRK
jgi:ubiquinone/menaquinone biosynthesis C-methylase UbiE